jgi:hypothetical protein
VKKDEKTKIKLVCPKKSFPQKGVGGFQKEPNHLGRPNFAHNQGLKTRESKIK